MSKKNIYTIILILRSIKLYLIKINWAFYWLSLDQREKAQSFNTKISSGSLYLFEGIREICSSHLIEEAHLSKAPDSNSSFYFIILIYRDLKVRPFFVVFFTFFAMRFFFIWQIVSGILQLIFCFSLFLFLLLNTA